MRIKRFISLILAISVIALLVPLSSAEGANAYFYGDVNFDGRLTTADATIVLKFAASVIIFSADRELALTGEGFAKADANKDSLVNTADASFILKFAAGMLDANTYTDTVTDFEIRFSSGSISQSFAAVPADRTFKAGEPFVITDIAIASGHEFRGWKADFDGCLYRIGDSFIMPSNDVLLTAIWDNESAPSPQPTGQPTPPPTDQPTETPTQQPTETPTQQPTVPPTQTPTPTPTPTATPTPTPTPNVIEIATKDDFMKIGTDSAYGMNKKYVLTADIDLGGEALYPRGYSNGSIADFTGAFDGQGHKLYNFKLTAVSPEGAGLFYRNSGLITNLYADCSPCTVTVPSCGMICYENAASGQIRGCGASGKMVYEISDSWLAGIASSNMGTIDSCWSNVEIEAYTSMVGGQPNYTHGGYSGMITAYNYNGTISNCVTFGSVKGSFVGAIFGQNSAGQGTGYVINCYSLSKVDFYYPEMYFNEIGFVPVVNGQMYYPNSTGFFYLKGMTYKQGELYPNKDNSQSNSYYGYALAENQFTAGIMNMYDTGIWDFSGQFPKLKNAAGMDRVEIKPYAG